MKLIYGFLWRLLVALAVGFTIVFLLVWRPYVAARSIARSQYKQTERLQGSLGIALHSIKAVTPLTKVDVGQYGPAALYRSQLQEYSNKVSPVSIKSIPKLNTNPAANRRFKLVRDVNKVITDYDLLGVYRKAELALTRADALLSYQTEIAHAIAGIIQYDPAIDTKKFKLGDDDTNQRLDRTEEGLGKAVKRLNDAKALGYKDPTLTEATGLVGELQKERDLLAASGDKDRWIEQFSRIRARLITNRHNFWVKEAALRNAEITDSYNQLTSIVRRWLRLTYSS